MYVRGLGLMTAFVASDLCTFLFSSYLSLNIICINNIFKGAYLPTTRDGSYEQYKRSRVKFTTTTDQLNDKALYQHAP